MNDPRSFWVTGASNGLGLALVQQLLEQGHRVAASSKAGGEMEALAQRHGRNLLRLPWQLHEEDQAAKAAEQICHAWRSLDGLIVNAATSDYLADDLPPGEVFEAIVNTNQLAAEHCLAKAQPLLARGHGAQVMAIFNRYSASQLFAPTQVTAGWNHVPQWVREQRQALKEAGIDLTTVAPQSPKTAVTPVLALPDAWTPETAAEVLLSRLALREPELVLEVIDIPSLWPLPR
ncbi:SDR family oxidoreductase [Pseudomonas sp. NPDC089401]|uniref:SDR family oxidoreductase n=1 Tax=Pseudomonas sp. NPDC089401 TaxID=3364462 RepID=UPI003827BF57